MSDPFLVWCAAVDDALKLQKKAFRCKHIDPSILRSQFAAGVSPVVFAASQLGPSFSPPQPMPAAKPAYNVSALRFWQWFIAFVGVMLFVCGSYGFLVLMGSTGGDIPITMRWGQIIFAFGMSALCAFACNTLGALVAIWEKLP